MPGKNGNERRGPLGPLACALAAATALHAASAAGQEAREPEGLEEVVVTARYRAENLQTSPIAITALPGEEMEARGLTNVTDIGLAVPNLYTHPGDAVNGPTPTISMRGVVAENYSFALEPAVGIYIDDVYHSTLVGSALDLTELERVEVRRGPQGTLTGNASIAGTMHLYTKTPRGDDSGYFQAGYGDRNEIDIRGAYDTALGEKVFLRLSGVSRRQDGYVDQLDFTCMMEMLGTPELAGTFPTADRSARLRGCRMGKFGGTNLATARTRLLWEATDRLQVHFLASYYNQNDEAPAELLIKPVPTPDDGFDSVYSERIFNEWGVVYDERFLPPPGRPYSSYATFSRPLEGIQFDNSQGQTATDGSFQIDYDLTDSIQLKAIVAYNHNDGFLHQAGDVSPLGYVQGYVLFDTEQRSSELRLTGTAFDNRVDWVVGAYLFDSDNNLSGDIDFITLNFTEDDYFSTESKSVFGHVDFHVTDRWSVSGGARYQNVAKTAVLDHPPLFDRTIPFSLDKGRSEWLLSTNYQPKDGLMFYASAATGSRPQGISTIVNTIWQLTEYPAEELTSYEMGFKSEWLQRRLRLNVNAFYSDYSKRLTVQNGYQCLGDTLPPTRVLDEADCPPGGAIGWRVYVATPAKVKGFELELAAEPVDGLRLNLAAGHHEVDNEIKTPGVPGYTVPGHFPQPELNMSGGVQFEARAFGGTLIPRLDWYYTSKQSFNRNASIREALDYEIEPAHSIYNAQIAYMRDDTPWTITLAVRNLTDEFYYHTRFDGSSVAIAGVVAEPREWSVYLRRDF